MRYTTLAQLVRFIDQMLEPYSIQVEPHGTITLIWENGHGTTRVKQVKRLFPGVRIITSGEERGLSFMILQVKKAE